MSRKELKRIVLLILKTAERVFHRLTPAERSGMKAALYGAGKPIWLAGEHGQRRLEALLRRGVLYVRLGLSPEAASSGGIEEGRRWQDRAAAALRDLMRQLGRKRLPVVLIVAVVEPDGTAIEMVRRISLLHGEGGFRG